MDGFGKLRSSRNCRSSCVHGGPLRAAPACTHESRGFRRVAHRMRFVPVCSARNLGNDRAEKCRSGRDRSLCSRGIGRFLRGLAISATCGLTLLGCGANEQDFRNVEAPDAGHEATGGGAGSGGSTGSGGVGGSALDGDCADCDGDGFTAPLDCDDLDDRVRPDLPGSPTPERAEPRRTGGWDYNCDGKETPLPGVVPGSCEDGGGLVPWVEAIPPCGGSAFIYDGGHRDCAEDSCCWVWRGQQELAQRCK